MTINALVTVEEATALIARGQPLMVAGSEGLLKRLPRGPWVGGTIPYFMGPDGGVLTHEKVFVTELPLTTGEYFIRSYDVDTLPKITEDGADRDCTFVIVPAFTNVHRVFGRDSQTWVGAFNRPLVGWVAGIDLKDIATAKPGVIDGLTGEYFSDRAVALHVKLKPGVWANVDTVNIFEQGTGDEITFPDAGFEVGSCKINGETRNFAEYLTSSKIDSKLPMVADYSGAMINVSFQTIDEKAGKVALYAPVFPEMTYRIAKPVGDYPKAFQTSISKTSMPVFGCNCILNYLYGKLEGQRTGHLVGPVTFGEIATLLLNQTLVTVTFEQGDGAA